MSSAVRSVKSVKSGSPRNGFSIEELTMIVKVDLGNTRLHAADREPARPRV